MAKIKKKKAKKKTKKIVAKKKVKKRTQKKAEAPKPVQPKPVHKPVLARQKKGLAIAGLVVGIVSFITSQIILGPLAIILSTIALYKIKNDPATYGGRGMALAGLVCGIITTIIGVIIVILLVTGFLVIPKVMSLA
ncbi:hypothetical protein DRJ17_01855 [Candidatus Woesearchaeota archaeon]|nr:MAG: hypothetical protein DRJ17_01855 [Candidatus Woesearchaeota archaeon]